MAEEFLNTDGSITKAASSEPNAQTVKSSYDPKPHILQPRGKNKFYLECDCNYKNTLSVQNISTSPHSKCRYWYKF